MTIIFQYGSNMSTDRFNSHDRMRGNAKVLSTALTKNLFDLRFGVWSTLNNCAAADLEAEGSRQVYGVLYDVPDQLVTRKEAHAIGRKSLDQIEGPMYRRVPIDVVGIDGNPVVAQTYLVVDPQKNLPTSFDYTSHMVRGIEEHAIPAEYKKYVIERIRRNNPAVADMYQIDPQAGLGPE